jgi:hypothetical protein
LLPECHTSPQATFLASLERHGSLQSSYLVPLNRIRQQYQNRARTI